MVVEHWPLVAARHHQQRPLFHGHIVEHDAHDADVVVGMRVIGPVLVPFHRLAAAARFHVELQAVLPDGVAQHLLQQSDDAGMFQNGGIGRMLLDRALDTPEAWLFGRMTVLQIEDIVADGDVARSFEEIVGDAL